jgi:hypothetical protein
VSITHDRAGTGHPNYEFRYDRHDRLSDMIGTYANGSGYEFWRRFFWDQQDRINLEVEESFGSTSEVTPIGVFGSFLQYRYDDKNRVNWQLTTWNTLDTYPIVTYAYDAANNLKVEGDPTYDDQMNFKKTNWIWMFLDRDFSLNNRHPAVEYNRHGLPTRFDIHASSPPKLSFLSEPPLIEEIHYSCD